MHNLLQGFTAAVVSRGVKYAFLFLAMAALLLSIFVTYSYYEIRRHIDADVRAVDPRLSTDEVMFKFAQLRNVKREIYVLRCLQRDAIAAYRTATRTVRGDLSQIYGHTLLLRETMLKQIGEWEATRLKENKRPVVDVDKTKEKLKLSWGVTRFDDIVILPVAAPDDIASFKTDIWERIIREYGKFDSIFKDIARRNPALGENIARMGSELPRGVLSLDERNLYYLQEGLQKADQSIFDLSYVGALQTRIERLEDSIKAQKLETSNWLGVAIQKRMAELPFTGADTPQTALDVVIDEFGDPQKGGEVQLLDLNCSPVDAAIEEINILREKAKKLREAQREKALRDAQKMKGEAASPAGPRLAAAGMSGVAGSLATPDDGGREDSPADAQLLLAAGGGDLQGSALAGMLMTSPGSENWIGDHVGRLFALPTTILTYLVTMLFGVLGGVTICTLRLSQHGVWAPREEPAWSEIFIAPLLGAVAATAIFLLWSVGLVVAAGSGPGHEASVGGAAFVGLLGFLSGLLHEDAFGRLKSVGEGWFRPDGASDAAPTSVDGDLAEKLRQIGCHRLAELTMIHKPGGRLADLPDFTLVALDDGYFENAPGRFWFELRQRSGATKFDQLLDRMTLTAKLDLSNPPPTVATVAAPQVPVPTGKDGPLVTVGAARLNPQKQAGWSNGLLVSANREISAG